MEEPRIVQLPAYRVVKLRYRGPPPPAPAFLEHWRRFTNLAALFKVASQVEGVQAIGYAPPELLSDDLLVYDSCFPIADDYANEGTELEVASLPGGRFVLCAGPIVDLPDLLQAAKRFAMSQGLAIERGRIELYRPLPPGAEVTPVDVGYRLHD